MPISPQRNTERLIFTPNEEMVQTIVLFLPAALKRQFRQG